MQPTQSHHKSIPLLLVPLILFTARSLAKAAWRGEKLGYRQRAPAGAAAAAAAAAAVAAALGCAGVGQACLKACCPDAGLRRPHAGRWLKPGSLNAPSRNRAGKFPARAFAHDVKRAIRENYLQDFLCPPGQG
eukprot:1161325-Pelagomonas_calceolata.AAC.7